MIKIVSSSDLTHLSQIIEKSKNYLYAKGSEAAKQ